MTQKLNILMLNHNPKGAGTYFRCFHFGRELVKRGHRVTLFTGGSTRFLPRTEFVDGVRVVCMPRFRRLADLVVPGGLETGFLDILIRAGHAVLGSYDLIHGFDHLPNVSFPSYLGRRLRRTCFVSDWCDWWSRGGFPVPRFKSAFRQRMDAFLEEGIRRVADGVTTISSVLFDRAAGLGVPPERMTIIPSGADVDNIRPGDKLGARRRLGLPADARVLGFVGFVDIDIDLVLTALAKVAGRVPQARALVVGERDRAQATARKLGIEDRVTVAGIKPYHELPDYFAASDVLAMPLRDTLFNRARWPNKVGDYLAAGRPTVTNPVGDVRYVFEKHPVGLLAAPDDPDDFARQVLRLFEEPGLADRMGAEARRLAEGEYSWARMTDRLEEFYHLTLSNRKAGARLRQPRART